MKKDKMFEYEAKAIEAQILTSHKNNKTSISGTYGAGFEKAHKGVLNQLHEHFNQGDFACTLSPHTNNKKNTCLTVSWQT